MLERYNVQTFTAVGTAVWEMRLANPYATKFNLQIVGSGNFSATVKLNNFDNDTDWSDVTSTLFGLGAIVAFGYYSADNWDLPGKVSLSVDSIQSSRTIKVAQGWS
jgi:hypothetical protein